MKCEERKQNPNEIIANTIKKMRKLKLFFKEPRSDDYRYKQNKIRINITRRR